MAQPVIEPVQKVIENPTDKTAWILICIAIAINIVQLIQNVLIAKKVEKFKDDLAKNQFKFTRHTELQIECLKNLYDQIVSFHFSFTNLIKPLYKTHKTLKANIVALDDSFVKVMQYSHRNKILLTDEIVNEMRIIHNKVKKIEIITQAELDSLYQLEDKNSSFEPEEIYTGPIAEVKSIQKAINRLNENDDVKTFEADILKLRKSIEIYFKQLVG